jgi:hypothetical protein
MLAIRHLFHAIRHLFATIRHLFRPSVSPINLEVVDPIPLGGAIRRRWREHASPGPVRLRTRDVTVR